jgi:hypothetical protein
MAPDDDCREPSFPRKRESMPGPLPDSWIPACAGMIRFDALGELNQDE